MDASAVPQFRNGGPLAAAQTFGARDRHMRGEAASMVDVTAGSGAAAPGTGLPSLSEIGRILKRGDLALALGQKLSKDFVGVFFPAIVGLAVL